MIYTIGDEKSYRDAMLNKGKIYKIGRKPVSEDWPDGCIGGYAFQTIEDAERRITEEDMHPYWIVWGLDTDWSNTVPSDEGWWSHLLEDAYIIDLAVK